MLLLCFSGFDKIFQFQKHFFKIPAVFNQLIKRLFFISQTVLFTELANVIMQMTLFRPYTIKHLLDIFARGCSD